MSINITNTTVKQVQLSEHLRGIIAYCSGQDINLVADSAWLGTDLYIDSLILTEIIYKTESEFNIQINDDDIDGVHQVLDYYMMVSAKLAMT